MTNGVSANRHLRRKSLTGIVGGGSALPIAHDPVERWLYPELDCHQAHFPEFVAASGAGAFEHGTVWKLGDLAAVALWIGPGLAPDGDAIAGVLAATVAAEKHDHTFAVLEQMDRAHSTFPHWYLPWSLYERHGSDRVAVARAGACPPVTSMLRRAPG